MCLTNCPFFDGKIRPLSTVLDQLERATDSGDITPLEHFHFLYPEKFGAESEDIFIPEAYDKNTEINNKMTNDLEDADEFQEIDNNDYDDNTNSVLNLGRRVLNPAYYDKVINSLKPIFSQQKKILIMAGSIPSAERITEYLKQKLPSFDLNDFKSPRFSPQSIAALHSKSKNQEQTIEDYRNGKINVLVTVNKFDEAVDNPLIDAVIILSPTSSPRQLIQRLARPARLSHGKELITAAMFIEATEDYLAEQLELIDRVLEGKFSSNYKYIQSNNLRDNQEIQSKDYEKKELAEIRAKLIEFRDKNQQSLKLTHKYKKKKWVLAFPKPPESRSQKAS